MIGRFFLQGRPVSVPWYADVQADFRSRGNSANCIQRVLDGVEPWSRGEDPIETMVFDDVKFALHVVEVRPGSVVKWGYFAGHKARTVQPSPFVDLQRQPLTSSLTVELTMGRQGPILTRAYAGEYTPQLPWQRRARNADGGRQACVEFWRNHAYVYRPSRVAGLITNRPPQWYLDAYGV